MEKRRDTKILIAFLIILSFLTVMIDMPSDVQAVSGGWDSSTTLLDIGSGAANDPQIAVDSNGNAIAVWSQVGSSGNQSILANRYSAGVWSGAVWLEAGAGDATNPQIAMDNSGNAIVVWQQVDSSGNQSILANRYSAGAWGGAVWLEAGTGQATNPQVAMSSSGNAIVVWQQVGSSGNQSILANRYSAGAWGGAVWLEAGAGDASDPQIAMDNNGNAMVVWQQVDSSGYQSILANRYSAGVWGGATLLDDSISAGSNPQIAMDNNGNAIVVWVQVDDSGAALNIIQARSYSAGAWGEVTQLFSFGGYDIRPHVVMDNSGNVMVVWGAKAMSGPWGIAARRYSAGAWGEVTWLDAAQGGGNAHVAMDNNGNAIAVWDLNNDSSTHEDVYSMRYSAGAWETYTMLNSAGEAWRPQVAMDNNGNAMAVWQQVDSSGQQSIFAKRFFSGAVTPVTVPSHPILSSATSGNGKVTLVWTEPASNGGSPIDYYVIYQDGVALTSHQVGLTANIVGLTNGHEYSFTVAAHNLAGIGEKSNTVTSIPYTAPDAPMGLVGAPGDGQVTLNWTKPVFNGGRAIDYYIVSQGGVALPYHPTGLSTTIVGLVNGHTYSFAVSANNLAGVGPQSTIVTIIPSSAPTVPGAPTGLSTTSRDGQVSLSWSAPTSDGGAAIDYYIVNQNGTEVTRTTSTGVIVTGLVNGVSYSFSVAAHNAAGTGPQSSSVSAIPVALTTVVTVPDAPTGLTAAPGNTQVYLSWTAPSSDGGATIDHYIVYLNGTDVQHPTGTSVTITGLTNGQTYGFTVAAHNSVGIGTQTTGVSATPNPTPTVPGGPIGLTATPYDSQVSLSWTAPNSDGGASMDYYLVYVNGVARSDHYTTVSTTINGLTNGQQYTFTVAAHNSVGIGTWSAPAIATPSPVLTVPGAPTGHGASPGNGQVYLSWIAPSNNGGAAIDYYLVYVNGIVLSDQYQTTSATITGLMNGQQYNFTIAAHNPVGASAQSSAMTATPSSMTSVPGVPIGLTATLGNGQITLSWAAPSSNGGVVIDHYIVYQDGIAISHPLAASETISGLTNGQSYDFTVAAHNSIGTGIQTTVVTATPTSVDMVPGIPTDLIATAGVGKVILSWSAPAGSTGIDYIVYQNGVDVIHTSATSTTITGLTNGENYSFAVAAHNSAGVGTQTLSGTVSPYAASPNIATASTGIDSMIIYVGVLALLAAAIVGLVFVARRKKKGV